MDGNLTGVIILLVIYALISAADTALGALNDIRLDDMKSEGKKGVKQLKKLYDVQEKYSSASRLSMVTLAVIITALALNSDLVLSLKEYFKYDIFAYIITVAVLGGVITTVGELIPGKLASAHYEGFACVMSKVMYSFYCIMLPFEFVVECIAKGFAFVCGVDPKTMPGKITEEGILSIVDEGEEHGVIDEDESDMINNIIEFGDTTAQKIMTHRTDVVAMSSEASFREIVTLATDEHFSRIPVYEGTLDNIIGVVHIRALIQYIDKISPENFNLHDILNAPYFVPQSKKANDLLRELQSEKTHMAIVVDEYGGTAGIITMEDLIEFVFGNIQDEFDEEEIDTQKLDENTYVVDGTADFEETLEEIGLKLTKDEREELEYEKMAGFVMGELDRIPVKGDKVEFKDFLFEVTAVDEKRIEKIKITVPENISSEDEDEE